jgi:hypothetical protein
MIVAVDGPRWPVHSPLSAAFTTPCRTHEAIEDSVRDSSEEAPAAERSIAWPSETCEYAEFMRTRGERCGQRDFCVVGFLCMCG